MGDKKSGFPIRIKSGSATVRIYDRSDAYPYYRVAHYVGAKRRMKPFTHLADAQRQARQIAEQISAGEGNLGSMSGTDQLIYQRARDAIASLGQNITLYPYKSFYLFFPDHFNNFFMAGL